MRNYRFETNDQEQSLARPIRNHETLYGVGKGTALINMKINIACTTQAIPPVATAFHPAPFTMSFLTRKHMPVTADVKQMEATLMPSGIPPGMPTQFYPQST